MADTIAPAGMHILCIALRYNKPNKLTKVSYLLCFFDKTRASVLFLGFQYLELQNIYKHITNSVVSSSIDSGAGLVLSMVRFSPSIEQ